MNWKWHITVGVEKRVSAVLNKTIYEVFLNDVFMESKEYIGVGDGYDVIGRLTFEKVKIGHIEDSTLNLYGVGIRMLSWNPDLIFFVLPILKKYKVEKIKEDSSLYSLNKEISDFLAKNGIEIIK